MNEMTGMAAAAAGQSDRHNDNLGLRSQLGTSLPGLTPRQQEILRLLAGGFSYKEIAAMLGISHCTVRAHLHSIYKRLNVKSRARATIAFHEHLRQQAPLQQLETAENL